MKEGIIVSTVFGSLQIIPVNIYAHLKMHICKFTCEYINLNVQICLWKYKPHIYINTYAIFQMYMSVYKMHKCVDISLLDMKTNMHENKHMLLCLHM